MQEYWQSTRDLHANFHFQIEHVLAVNYQLRPVHMILQYAMRIWLYAIK